MFSSLELGLRYTAPSSSLLPSISFTRLHAEQSNDSPSIFGQAEWLRVFCIYNATPLPNPPFPSEWSPLYNVYPSMPNSPSLMSFEAPNSVRASTCGLSLFTRSSISLFLFMADWQLLCIIVSPEKTFVGICLSIMLPVHLCLESPFLVLPNSRSQLAILLLHPPISSLVLPVSWSQGYKNTILSCSQCEDGRGRGG